MNPDRDLLVLDAAGTYYREWAQDLLSREKRATGSYNEHDWQTTRDACKIVLVSKN